MTIITIPPRVKLKSDGAIACILEYKQNGKLYLVLLNVDRVEMLIRLLKQEHINTVLASLLFSAYGDCTITYGSSRGSFSAKMTNAQRLQLIKDLETVQDYMTDGYIERLRKVCE